MQVWLASSYARTHIQCVLAHARTGVGWPNAVYGRAGYVLLEVNAGGSPRVEFVRVDYDVEEAARGILASELPHDFAEYLRTGGKPAAAHAHAG